MIKTSGNETYKVVFRGRTLPGIAEHEARAGLAGTFLLDPMEAAAVLFDGKDSVLYKSNSRELAFEVNHRLNNAGLLCQVSKRTRLSHRSSRLPGGHKDFTLLLVTACAIALMTVLLI